MLTYIEYLVNHVLLSMLYGLVATSLKVCKLAGAALARVGSAVMPADAVITAVRTDNKGAQ